MNVAVVGAGAAGVELAFCLQVLLHKRGLAADMVVAEADRQILAGYAAGCRRRAQRELERRGINVCVGSRVTEVADRPTPQIVLGDGTPLPADLVLWTTGAAPPAVLENFRLPKTDDGFLAVRRTLQTTDDFPVFVVGDTAGFVDFAVPKAGVENHFEFHLP